VERETGLTHLGTSANVEFSYRLGAIIETDGEDK